MKKSVAAAATIVSAFAVALVVSTPASADDSLQASSIASESRWDGAYVGVLAGWARGSFDARYDSANFPPGVLGGPFGTFEFDGAALGGFAGIRRQTQSDWVFGVELDAQAMVGDDGFLDDNPLPSELNQARPKQDFVEARLNYLASARLNVGRTFDRYHAYLTGGVGLVDYAVDIIDVSSGENSQSLNDQL